MMNNIKKCSFSRSLFFNFSHAEDHWEVSYPGLEICCSLQGHLEVEPSGSQLVENTMKGLYGVGGTACANPT